MDVVIVVLAIVIISLLILRFFVVRNIKRPEKISAAENKNRLNVLMNDVKCIKVCMVFFVVLTVISLAVSIIIGINFFSLISKL